MKNSFRLLFACLATTVLAGCGGSGDEIEPNELVSFTSEKSINVVWSKNIGSNLGDKYHQLTPSIAGDAIFVTDREGNVSSYETVTGKLKWSVSLNIDVNSGIGAGEGKVLLTTTDGEVIALDSNTGESLWQAALNAEAVSPPQMNKEITVLQLVSGDIVALELATGEQRWVFTSKQPALTLRGNSSPLVALDATLAGLDNGKFVAIDNISGDVLWQQRVNIPKGKSDIERLTDLDGRPILYKNVIYISGYRGNLTAINPFNAQVLWRKPYSSYRGLAAANDNIYLSADNDVVHAIDTGSASEVWRQDQLLNRMLTSPSVLSDTVVVGDKQGYLHFLSPEDGRFVARYNIGDAILGDMLVKDNVLYTLSNSGKLSAITLK